MKTINGRTTEYDIDDIFLKRYSPRAMNGQPIDREELMTLFEAARWAPSEFNNQPWRFIFGVRGTPDFDLLLSFLKEKNQAWCRNAGALVLVLSKKTSDLGQSSPKYSIGTGAAWENLALQATMKGIVAHGMSGFYEEKMQQEFNFSDDFKIEHMIALGRPGKIEDLPEDARPGETPNNRKPLSEIIFEGKEGAKKLK